MAITTNAQQIAESKCYGIGYDVTAPECKVCEAATKCKQKTEGNAGRIPTPPANAKAADITSGEAASAGTSANLSSNPIPADALDKPKPKKKKPAVNYADDMPDFKSMSIDELKALATERGIDLKDFDKYTQEGIKRMRLTMALKKTYEVK